MLKTCVLLAGLTITCPVVPAIPADIPTTSTSIVQNVRCLTSSDSTKVIIDLDSDAAYESARLRGPDRIYLDVSNSKLSSSFKNNVATTADSTLLRQVRVAQNQSKVVRVVLDLSTAAEYAVSELRDPFRIVVDLQTQSRQLARPIPLQQASSPHPNELGSAHSDAGQVASNKREGLVAVVASTAAASDVIPPGEDPEPPATSSSLDTTEAQPLANEMLINKVQLPAGISSIRQDRPPERDMPLTVSGTLSTGYYKSSTTGGGNGSQKISFVPAGVTTDINGYYLDPDLLDYSIQTELNAGSQASDAGFLGGNGVRINVTTFRKGAVPVTFRYSNIQLKDAYFGSLTQLSSYTLQNRNKDLGLTAGVKLAGLPKATVDWGTSSVQSQSFSPVIPDYTSRSNHLNLNCEDHRWGWDLQCFAGRQQQTSDLFTPLNGESSSSLLHQRVTQYRASARHALPADSELYIDGGSQSTSNLVLNQPIDLTTRYATANLRMFQRRKWKASMRAGYTSNIAGLMLTQLVSGLGQNGSVAPEASVLRPFQHTTSYLNLSGLTSVDLSHGFGLYGSMDRTAVLTAAESGLSSRYLTTAGGVTYSHTFRWGSLSGQYGRSFGIGSITGQTGRIIGQNYVVTAQPGRPDGLLFDFSVRGSDQRVRNEIPARDKSFAADMGVGFPIYGRLRARLGGGWQRGGFSNEGNEFHTNGYTARAGIEHPRFQFNGSLNSSIGNTLQSYSEMLGGIGIGAAFLTPLHLVPSDLRGVTLTLHLIPMRKLEFSGLFTRSVQHLEGIVANDFEVIDLYVTFRFRKLQLVTGYFNSIQISSSYLAIYPETQRGRFYIRLSRPVKFL